MVYLDRPNRPRTAQNSLLTRETRGTVAGKHVVTVPRTVPATVPINGMAASLPKGMGRLRGRSLGRLQAQNGRTVPHKQHRSPAKKASRTTVGRLGRSAGRGERVKS